MANTMVTYNSGFGYSDIILENLTLHMIASDFIFNPEILI